MILHFNTEYTIEKMTGIVRKVLKHFNEENKLEISKTNPQEIEFCVDKLIYNIRNSTADNYNSCELDYRRKTPKDLTHIGALDVAETIQKLYNQTYQIEQQDTLQ